MSDEIKNEQKNELKGESTDYEFLKEQIKERPINRKKLVRQSILTVSFAIVFGLVACFTFIFLEPYIGNWINPQPQENLPVTLPEEEEEMLPEEMLLVDESKEPESVETNISTPVTTVQPQLSDYQLLYDKLSELATECKKCMVKVTAVSSDVDWLNNPYESTNQAAGLIVADNGKELMILTIRSVLEQADSIRVTFNDGTSLVATPKLYDKGTGLTVIAVDYTLLTDDMKENMQYAALGSSQSSTLPGSVVIALGSPLGYGDSMCYGMVTSNNNTVNLEDANYSLITTDIYGSTKANGILFNMRGQVIGIINQSHNSNDMKNMISAYGATELRPLIEKLSNTTGVARLGLFVTDVTPEAQESYGIPEGSYVTNVVMDSPAMMTGIRKGDIVVGIDETHIYDAGDYITEIREHLPEDVITITIMRANTDGYREIEFTVTLDEMK